MPKKLGILTAGGDCAGLNTVIASIVRAGVPKGYEFIGFEKGWEGVLTPTMYRPLTLEAVRGISHLGGTILRTTNKGRFAAKVGEGEVARIAPEILEMAKNNLAELGVEGMIVIGGDGTLSGAMQLADLGVNIVGVPKTIDNDLSSTDRTFGFSTAVQVATEAIDKIHTTATSHDRVIIVECMGRLAGWIALHAGLAGSANAIIIPEVPFSIDTFTHFLRRRQEAGRNSSVVVIAEGVKLDHSLSGRQTQTSSEMLLGGVSHHLMRLVEEVAPGEFDMRSVVLGHTQRGGTPNAEDRILAKRYGIAALEAYEAGKFGHMVALQGNQMVTVDILAAVGELKRVSEISPEYQAARQLGMFIE